jgi:tetratricopeptide (TPR) repeat protein
MVVFYDVCRPLSISAALGQHKTDRRVADDVAEKGGFIMGWSALIPTDLRTWISRRRALRELEDLQKQEEWSLALDDGNLINRAKVALASGDRTAAQCFWQEALLRYPLFAGSSHDSLEVLLGLQRFDEAEAMMLDAQQRIRDPFYAEGYAMVAERRGDIEEAIRRWSGVRKRFPGYWMSYVHGAGCLCQAGQLEAAEELSEQAINRFPNEIRTWLGSARTAEHRRDWPTAIRRWQTVCEKFQHVQGDVGVARGLEGLGRIEEAEERLKDAQTRRPLVAEIAIALARLADQRGDKEEAVLRWADTQRRFPLLPFGYQGGFRQLMEMDRHIDAGAILLAAIRRFPTEAWPAVEYALLAHTRQDWAVAATRWAAVRASWPDRRDGYLRGIEASAALGHQEEVVQLRIQYERRFAP